MDYDNDNCLNFAAGRIFNTRLRLWSCPSLTVIFCGLRQASGEACPTTPTLETLETLERNNIPPRLFQGRLPRKLSITSVYAP